MTKFNGKDCTVVSAPGKVLLTGGYLVLDQAYQGLVVGTTSRFYTAIQEGKRDPEHSSRVIRVRSPQFVADAEWSYSFGVKETGDLYFETLQDTPKNKFVETCLYFTLQVIYEKIGLTNMLEIPWDCLSIVIVADNDFYSQRAELEAKGLPKTASGLASLEPFCSTHATLGTVHKTGLGSSAALTTSLVAALLVFFRCADLEKDEDKALIHNLAQFVHCFAQGKVGSGFDVSAAVWGNHRYTRFSPNILAPLMNDQVSSGDLVKRLHPTSSNWDNVVVPFHLPPGMELILGDVDAGSHTPTLVGKVLAWRKSCPEQANALWNELGKMNARVEQHFRDLSKAAFEQPDVYQKAIAQCASLKASEWENISDPSTVTQKLVDLTRDFGAVRKYLQQMSELSQVPIEPPEQTRLLDACMNVEGVAMAGVPGAGGYDAIFCIVLSANTKLAVRKLWESWSEMNIGPLLAQADNKGITAVLPDSVPGLSRFLL